MDKFKLAHDYFMKHGRDNSWMASDVIDAWKYADAMQAEADKRIENNGDTKEGMVFHAVMSMNEFRDACVKPNLEEWQPDWSQAPDDAVYWIKSSMSGFVWLDGLHKKISSAPSFGYDGGWLGSLRKRP